MGNQLPLIKSCCSASRLRSGVQGVLCSIHHAAMQQPPATDRLWLSARRFGTGPGWSLPAGAVGDAPRGNLFPEEGGTPHHDTSD